MNIKERAVQVKTHLQDNKKTYLVGGGCLVAGYFLRPQVVNVVDVCNLKYKSPTTTTVITVLERRACKEPIPIRCIETGEVFGSIRRASAMLDISRQLISDQLQGKIDTANDLHFEPVA